MKLCKDCKFSKITLVDRLFFFGYKFARCSIASPITRTDYSTGKTTTELRYCTNERTDYSHTSTCGSAGKNFQPKREMLM